MEHYINSKLAQVDALSNSSRRHVRHKRRSSKSVASSRSYLVFAGYQLNIQSDRIDIVTYPDPHGPILSALVHIKARNAQNRRTREGARSPATRRQASGRSTRTRQERHVYSAIASKYSAREDDLMTNASKIGCLPEQTTAYWDAALEPTLAASNAEKIG